MGWHAFYQVVELRGGQLRRAVIALRDDAGGEAALHLFAKSAARLEGAAPNLQLALEAAAYATGMALRLEAPHPGGVRLFVDGREQKVIKRYGAAFRQVADLADAYADSVEP